MSKRNDLSPVCDLICLSLVLFAVCFGSKALAEDGQLTREVWESVEGDRVLDITQRPSFYGGADQVELIDSVEIPSFNGNYYGSRLRGTFIAPVTGEYVFWISGDDASELWISSDESKFNRKLVAYHEWLTKPLDWDKFEEQRSKPLFLEAGQEYYLEVRHKDGLHDDHLAIAWEFFETSTSNNLTQLAGAIASQSDTQWQDREAINAIDGNTKGQVWEGDLISQTTDVPGSWWQVDLGATCSIDNIAIWNQQGELGVRLANFRVSLLDAAGAVIISRDFHGDGTFAKQVTKWRIPGAVSARTVRIEKLGPSSDATHFLTLAEVEVFGLEIPEPPVEVNLTQEIGAYASQSETLWKRKAEHAIDGNQGGARWIGDLIATTTNEPNSWWEVEFGNDALINRVVLWNEAGVHALRLSNFRISLIRADGTVVASGDFFTDGTHAEEEFEWELGQSLRANRVRIQRLGPDEEGNNFLNIAEVEVFGYANRLAEVKRRLLSSDYLRSFEVDSSDLDDDDLIDAWEQTYGFDTQGWQGEDFAYFADSDGDFQNNGEESLLGTDPFQADFFAGHLTHERWKRIPYDSLRETLEEEDRIYDKADSVSLLPASSTGFRSDEKFYHQRIRGYVQAPTTGMYRFWLSARYGAQLFLSTLGDKYHKELLLEVGPEAGTGNGSWEDLESQWEWYVAQRSHEIYLEAGEKYYLEAFNQHGHWAEGSHLSLAWTPPGGERQLIPSEYLSSYSLLPEDGDDDSLPDLWEGQFGLDSTDNGLRDRRREGERGDFDRDGLSNHEEYRLGTNPANADTDGDGYSDADEFRLYGSNPTVSNFIEETEAQSVSVLGVAELGTTWEQDGESVKMKEFRGAGTWSFQVPEAGFWILTVEGILEGDLRLYETMPVEVTVGGSYLGREVMNFADGVAGKLRIITPWLEAGDHDLELFFDNYMARRVVKMISVSLVKPGGRDWDGNGRPDYVEQELAAQNAISPQTEMQSYVSPAFIEGRARSVSDVEFFSSSQAGPEEGSPDDGLWGLGLLEIKQVRLETANLMALDSTLDRSILGSALPVNEGPGSHRWFAKVPLVPQEVTGYSVFTENGAITESGVVVWKELNLVEIDDIEIPVHSSLLLGAWLDSWDESNLTYTLGDETRTGQARVGLPWLFDTAGEFLISVSHENTGEIHELLVKVRRAALPSDIVLAENVPLSLTFAEVAPDLELDSDGSIGVFEHNPDPDQATASQVILGEQSPGFHRMAVRLGEKGPLLDVQTVRVVGYSDAMRNGNDESIGVADDLMEIRSTFLLTYLPEGGYAKLTIFRAGVMFLDGTTVKTITNADLDDTGVAYLHFLFPVDEVGGYCHYTEIFDGNGQLIRKH